MKRSELLFGESLFIVRQVYAYEFSRFAAPSQPEKLEIALYTPFAFILQSDVSGKHVRVIKKLVANGFVEFIPYVFQLFAALLEANPSASLSQYYKSLIVPILTVDLWTSKGNVPALVRLLSSLIPRGASDITANNQVEPILGIFKMLVATKTNEVYAFELLECVVSNFSP